MLVKEWHTLEWLPSSWSLGANCKCTLDWSKAHIFQRKYGKFEKSVSPLVLCTLRALKRNFTNTIFASIGHGDVPKNHFTCNSVARYNVVPFSSNSSSSVNQSGFPKVVGSKSRYLIQSPTLNESDHLKKKKPSWGFNTKCILHLRLPWRILTEALQS